jgi:hypothetical protein
MRAVCGRPPLEWQQGGFFRWAAPAGWRADETPNGVDINSPDGVTAACSRLLGGARLRAAQRFCAPSTAIRPSIRQHACSCNTRAI